MCDIRTYPNREKFCSNPPVHVILVKNMKTQEQYSMAVCDWCFTRLMWAKPELTKNPWRIVGWYIINPTVGNHLEHVDGPESMQ